MAGRLELYVGGVKCRGYSAAAAELTRALGREATERQAERAVKSGKPVGGVSVLLRGPEPEEQSERKPAKEARPELAEKKRRKGGALLAFPKGKSPADLGLPERWA